MKVEAELPGARWTEAELQALRNLIAEEQSREQIAQALGKTKAAIHLKARQYGLSCSRKNTKLRPWTKEEDNALTYYGALLTRSQIAKKLKRTESAVSYRANILGIRLAQGRITLKALAEELGVSKATVVRARDKLGLKFRRYPSKHSSYSKPRGPEPEDVVAIAQYLSTRSLSVSRKRLMEVIAAYGG